MATSYVGTKTYGNVQGVKIICFDSDLRIIKNVVILARNILIKLISSN